MFFNRCQAGKCALILGTPRTHTFGARRGRAARLVCALGSINYLPEDLRHLFHSIKPRRGFTLHSYNENKEQKIKFLYKKKHWKKRPKNMGEFRIGDILCKLDCRFGLTDRDYEICDHVCDVRMKELAAELLAFEQSQKTPSELFEMVQIYVDDPKFWSFCLNFSSKLQRHSPVWVQNAFVNATKHQLLRLSGKELTKCDQQLFLQRIGQLLEITQYNRIENLEQDIEYWISNIKRVHKYN